MPFKSRLFFVIVVCSWLSSSAQYGFEWIRPYQPYFKFKIASEGIFTIDSSLLAQSGLQLTGVHPGRIQVFRDGVEIPIFIHGQGDGVLNAKDRIEFYARPNDGKMDQLLYQQPAFQPHQWQSMITDTAVYFLTVVPDTAVQWGRRYVQTSNTNFGAYAPEPYFTYEVKVHPQESKYRDGPPLAYFGNDPYTSSEYLDGEGWASNDLGLGQSRNYSLATPFKASVGPLPVLSAKIIPTNNPASSGNNHHVRLSLGPDNAAFTPVWDKSYLAHAVQKFDTAVNHSQIGNTETVVKMEVIDDLGVLVDYNALSYARLTYSRLYNLGGQAAIRYTLTPVQAGTWAHLAFAGYGNGSETTPILFDMSTGRRISGVYTAGVARMLDSSDGTAHEIYLADSIRFIAVNSLSPVQFKVIDPSQNYEYLFVTHPILQSAATEYVNYRALKYKVLSVFSQELYDYYTYGNMHPLAVRRFASHLLHEASVKPKFLMLAGRGFQTSLFRDPQMNAVNVYDGNLVPAIGVPSSDVMLTAGLTGSGFEADIPTGRIPAETNNDLDNYLQKLKTYESTGIQEWRKNVLHVSGGDNAGAQTIFSNYLRSARDVISKKYFGANVTSYNKSVSSTTTENLKEKLLKIQNDGISLLTFLGHGSSTVLDVDIGSISELNNTGKYPLYYFNGCNIGNPNQPDPGSQGRIYGKDYICTAGKGAIGWLAHSNLTVDGNLGAQIGAFYNQFSIVNYGQPIGTIVREASRTFAGSDVITKMHNLQLTLQGDPATVIYSPPLPDYKITGSDLFITPKNANALSDSFALGVIITNLGSADDDTLQVSVTRTMPNGSKRNYALTLQSQVYYKDTVYIWIKSKDKNSFGNNTFDVILDKENYITESSKTNNSASSVLFIPGTGLNNLFPLNCGIVNHDTVAFVTQNNDLFATNSQYIFELDTNASFTSPVYRSSGIVTAGALATWKVVLPHTDTLVYFWRARLNIPVQQGGSWNDGSFTYISNGAEGWAQSHFDQYSRGSDLNLLKADTSGKKLEFVDNFQVISSSIRRWNHGNMGNFSPYNLDPSTGTCITNGVVVDIFNGRTLQSMQHPKFPFNCSYVISRNASNGDVWYYTFNTTLQSGRDELRAFIDSLDEGTYVAMWARYDAQVRNWDTATKNVLSKVGSKVVGAMQSEYSTFAMIGRKGWAPGLAQEDTLYNDKYAGQGIPNILDQDTLRVEYNMQGKWFTGSMVSEKVGPAKQWGKVFYHFHSVENAGSDNHIVDLIGVKADGTDTLLVANIQNAADISAITLQALRLKVTFTDLVDRTPDQFGRWMITYQGVPEGTLSTTDAYEFYSDKLGRGDSLSLKVAFRNLTPYTFDSVPVRITITDDNRVTKYDQVFMYAPLAGDTFMVIAKKLSTLNLAGANTLQLQVNGNSRTPELSLNNNTFVKLFTVDVDKRNPVMDVTFDGYRIMNGDYVSPTPRILITSNDDNKFLLQQDTSTFELYLRKPSGSAFEKVSMGSESVRFVAATTGNNKAMLEYTPAKLPDGLYTLQVISKDASGNYSGTTAYTIDFNVLGASTITDFFPYPNPCTTNMKFVFTLTGAKLPDDLLVRIMTVSGTIIREVTKDEFGPIHIGNNISEWAWDGTDNYGDRLANGVYLYQVLTRINNQEIEKFKHATVTEAKLKSRQYFVQNTGKIYLMK